MPIYEYECDKCGVRFDQKQGIFEEPINACPHCPGTTRRIIQPVGIVFKAGGFYVTDNRPKAKEETETKVASVASETKETKETKTATEVTTAKKDQ
ncbi:MAG: zinc ribbon domain-containing protein [Dehalococcoidia bacterium]|nr:zinc ribbon domain-containing protein [Dehalococcoidia bacterium]